MFRSSSIVILLFVSWTALAGSARGQLVSLADDIILISKGVENEEQSHTGHRGGPEIGGTGNSLGFTPGGRALHPARAASASFSGYRANRDFAQSISSEGQQRPQAEELGARPTQVTPAPLPPKFLGALELPEGDDEGPANGLTLDIAIGQLTRQNFELRARAFEIPQARADVLTASLRANPLVFGSVGGVPYGSYSPQRPGETNYAATVIYPFDVSHKRRARTESACQVNRIVEAQYQDAVRMEIEKLYAAYLDVIAARETLRYARASVAGMRHAMRVAENQLENRQIARVDLDRMGLQLDTAELGVEQATIGLQESKHGLGLLLAMPIEQSEQIELRGSIRDTAPPPPDSAEVIAIARARRPDLVAYRLGIQRAQADVRLAQAEKSADVFMLYSPYELRNNTPTGGQNATSWSVAAFGSVPLFNRNQGNIRRAEVNVSQSRTELAGLEQQVVEEVHHAYVEYVASRDVIRRLETNVLPRSRRIRDATSHLLTQGELTILDFLSAQREHNEIVRQYRDALIRHRRSMLKLNTAVGERLLP